MDKEKGGRWGTSQWVKCLVYEWVWGLKFGPSEPGLDMTVCMYNLYNPSEPMRWEAEQGILWKITGQIIRDSFSREKVRTDTRACPFTSTRTQEHMRVCSHLHTCIYPYTRRKENMTCIHSGVLFSHRRQHYITWEDLEIIIQPK